MRELDSGLRDVLAGRKTFDAFVRETAASWRWLAGYLLRRWRIPVWVSPEDVVQDLHWGAWEALWKFDPARGKSISQFVVFAACDRAKKRIHKARNAKRRDDRAPSRMERSYAATWGEEAADRRAEEATSEPGAQEAFLAHLEAVERALAACETEVEREVIARLARAGSLEECTWVIYADPEARRACGAQTPEGVARVVVEAAAVVAGRLESSAA